jgi:hypothetical protein
MTATPAALTWRGVTARRMARHALAEPATDLGPDGVAGLLCGAHAQVLSAAEFSIGRRIAGATRTDVLPGQDVRPARHRPPAARHRPADVDRGAVGPAVTGTDPPGGRPLHC